MAVQKSKKSRAARNMRRSHDHVKAATLSIDGLNGRLHRRHHMTEEGIYRGQMIRKPNLSDTAELSTSAEAVQVLPSESEA